MTVGELRELLGEYPEDFGVMIDTSGTEDEYEVFYDVLDVESSQVSNIVYIVAE